MINRSNPGFNRKTLVFVSVLVAATIGVMMAAAPQRKHRKYVQPWTKPAPIAATPVLPPSCNLYGGIDSGPAWNPTLMGGTASLTFEIGCQAVSGGSGCDYCVVSVVYKSTASGMVEVSFKCTPMSLLCGQGPFPSQYWNETNIAQYGPGAYTWLFWVFEGTCSEAGPTDIWAVLPITSPPPSRNQ